MSILATLAVTLTFPAAPQGGDAILLLRDACIETGLQRAAFERLGRERRWRPQRITRQSGQPGWAVVFRADAAVVMLTSGPQGEGGEPGLGAACSVSVEQASPGLEGEVAALAASLGLDGEGLVADTPPGVVPIRVWSRFGGQTLTYAGSADGRAIISFSRQIVNHPTDPVSPLGAP